MNRNIIGFRGILDKAFNTKIEGLSCIDMMNSLVINKRHYIRVKKIGNTYKISTGDNKYELAISCLSYNHKLFILETFKYHKDTLLYQFKQLK